MTNTADWTCIACAHATQKPLGWVLKLAPDGAVIAAYCRACSHLEEFGPSDRIVRVEESPPPGAVALPLRRATTAPQAARATRNGEPPQFGLRGLARAIRQALARYLLEG